MQSLINTVQGLSKLLNVIAGLASTFIMFLTVTDVILRSFRRPIVAEHALEPAVKRWARGVVGWHVQVMEARYPSESRKRTAASPPFTVTARTTSGGARKAQEISVIWVPARFMLGRAHKEWARGDHR